MANIRKVNRPKPWVVEWRVDGEKVSQSFKRKADADAFEAAIEDATRNRGERVDPRSGRVLFSEAAETWLAIRGVDLTPKTIASYRSLLDSRILPTFGARSISNIPPESIDAWVADMRADGLSPSRIRQAFVVLNAILELAVRHGRIGRNPARGTDLPAIRRKEAPYLDPATVDAIVAAVLSATRWCPRTAFR